MVCTYRAIQLARNRSVIVKRSKLPLAVLGVNYYSPSFHGYLHKNSKRGLNHRLVKWHAEVIQSALQDECIPK